MKKASPWIFTVGFSLLAFSGLLFARVIHLETVLNNGEPALVLLRPFPLWLAGILAGILLALSGRFRAVLKSSMAGLCFLPGFLVTAFLTFGKTRGVRSAVAQTLGIGVLFHHSPPDPQRIRELHPWILFGDLSEFFAGVCLILLIVSVVNFLRSPKKADYFRWNTWSLTAFLSPFLLSLWDGTYQSALVSIQRHMIGNPSAKGQFLLLYLAAALCAAMAALFFTEPAGPEEAPSLYGVFGIAAGVSLLILAYYLISTLSLLPLPKLRIDRECDTFPLTLCGAAFGAACALFFRKRQKEETLTSP